ncbi:type 1 glutamine amidotransferase domain-containing protein [Cryobacterium arcticum]|uniref:Type 1 glutamine amidotransferase domain-containing protein n=1 Tax=Cryobacterium arcticum TaxID=670052 RepID=A0A317ZQ54_9MICO|nr:type 1 glutamine amidotransferase domain-containing protein [Cryobacterium arcticum]PXA68008.1 type 1 glutamine amidotransferase domain-containing protein [Cryobacterium arcticum]
MTSVLFVVSAADHWTLNDGSLHPTGYWAEELAEPHRLFSEAGWSITIATPKGMAPTVDEGSLAAGATGSEERSAELHSYLEAIPTLTTPVSLDEVSVADYDVVFYPGGHGPMEDLATDPTSGQIMTDALTSGRILGVLCHAPAAMLAAEAADGTWPFLAYRMTGFTDAEEALGGLAPKAKWLVQARLTELGAAFVEGPSFGEHIEIDRNLYTGQNPASSVKLATAIIDAVATQK